MMQLARETVEDLKKLTRLNKNCMYRFTNLSTNFVYKIIYTHTFKLLNFVLCKQVQGTLIESNAYLTPFQLICVICSSPTRASTSIKKNAMFDYVRCN
jgi:hypothetical protein